MSGYKIVVYEVHPETAKVKRVTEFLRDPKTKKFFTRAQAQEFSKHLFTHEYDQEKYEIYVEPISAQTSSLDGAKLHAIERGGKCWGVRLQGGELPPHGETWLQNRHGTALLFPSKKAAESAAAKQRQIWITRPTKRYWIAYPALMAPYASEAQVTESITAFAGGGYAIGSDGAKARPKMPKCVKKRMRQSQWMTKHEALRMCEMVGMPLKYSQKPPKEGEWADFMDAARAKSKSHESGSHKLRRVGTSRKCHQCDKCGKTGLKQTCVMERSGDKARFHYGSECAKRKSHDKLEEKWFTYKDWIKDVEERVVDHLVSAPTPIWNQEARKLFNEHKRKTSEALLERWKAHEPAFSVALDIAETLIPKARRESRHKHTLAMEEFESPKPVPTWEGKCLEEMISSGIAKNQREAFYLCIQAQQAGIAPRELVKRIKSKKGRWLIPVGLGVGLVAGLGISKAAGVI